MLLHVHTFITCACNNNNVYVHQNFIFLHRLTSKRSIYLNVYALQISQNPNPPLCMDVARVPVSIQEIMEARAMITMITTHSSVSADDHILSAWFPLRIWYDMNHIIGKI